MPLTWDATKCDLDFDNEIENVITQTIVLMMPAIGMRQITDSNWKEVYGRIKVLHKLHGSFMYLEGSPYTITYKDVRARIWLKTNSSVESRRDWANKIMTNLISDTKWDIREE